jgi:hypothetical protein
MPCYTSKKHRNAAELLSLLEGHVSPAPFSIASYFCGIFFSIGSAEQWATVGQTAIIVAVVIFTGLMILRGFKLLPGNFYESTSNMTLCFIVHLDSGMGCNPTLI